LKGKIAYMSPEQLRGERIDRRTDVFAMGILLYMMTTGTHPFRGDDQSQTIRRISDDEPVTPPSAIVPGYPAGLEAVVLQSLAKDASKRYPTANDMLIGLTRALPASMRPSTDEEVAEFLRALLPDRLEKRKSLIKGALEAADRREAGKSSPRMPEDSPDEAPTVLEGLVSSREVTPSAESQQSLPGPSGREPLPVARDSRRVSDRNRVRTALSAALIAALGIIVALLISRRPGPAVAANDPPAVSPTLGVVRDPPPPADEPAVKPMEPLPPMPLESAAPAKSAAPLKRVPIQPKKPEQTFAKPASSGTTFVSPVRVPGF
jgi:serine/threonine-protein kinase